MFELDPNSLQKIEKAKSMLTLKLLKRIQENLIKMNYISLDSFQYDFLNSGTAGWVMCLFQASKEVDNMEFYDIYDSFGWIESDNFDSIIEDELVKNKLLLKGDKLEMIARELGLDKNDIEECAVCSKVYPKEFMHKEKCEYDDEYFNYVCKHCKGFDYMEWYRGLLEKEKSYQVWKYVSATL